MEEDEFKGKQENGNSTLRDIFEEFIGNVEIEVMQTKEVTDELKALADDVLRKVDRMLSMRKAIFFDNGYPYNRRFQREEFWQFAKEEFSDDELELGDLHLRERLTEENAVFGPFAGLLPDMLRLRNG